jgi:hypothetical protein
MVLVFIQLSAYLVVPEYHHPILKILKIPGILKILILTRKGVCKNARPLQCNSIGRCTMIVINPKNSLGIILDAQKGGFDIVHLIPQPCYP